MLFFLSNCHSLSSSCSWFWFSLKYLAEASRVANVCKGNVNRLGFLPGIVKAVSADPKDLPPTLLPLLSVGVLGVLGIGVDVPIGLPTLSVLNDVKGVSAREIVCVDLPPRNPRCSGVR